MVSPAARLLEVMPATVNKTTLLRKLKTGVGRPPASTRLPLPADKVLVRPNRGVEILLRVEAQPLRYSFQTLSASGLFPARHGSFSSPPPSDGRLLRMPAYGCN